MNSSLLPWKERKAIKTIKELLELGADPNGRSPSVNHPLIHGVRSCWPSVVLMLISAGASVDLSFNTLNSGNY